MAASPAAKNQSAEAKCCSNACRQDHQEMHGTTAGSHSGTNTEQHHYSLELVRPSIVVTGHDRHIGHDDEHDEVVKPRVGHDLQFREGMTAAC
jgi:hypothetical protein